MREWLSETLFSIYEVIQPVYGLAFILLIILVPLGLYRRTRRFSVGGLIICSYVFGIAAWLYSAAFTFAAMGWVALIVGLMILGLGVIFIAFFGALLNGMYGIAFVGVLLPVVLSIASHIIAQFLVEYTE